MAPRTIVVAGNGTNSLSFQFDGPDITDVEAVLAEIDTGGAGDTTATLTASSPAGSDVAVIPQGQAVSGGGQGRATWALRLAEDAGSGGGALETTDGVTTVNPTTELFINPGLTLAGVSPIAALGAATARYALADQNPASQALAHGAVVAFTPSVQNGIGGGLNRFTALTAGEYFAYGQAAVQLPAGAAAGTAFGMASARSGGGQFYFSNWVLPVAVPIGQVFQVNASVSRPFTLAAGQSVQFTAVTLGPNVTILGGLFAMFGLF